MRLQKRRAAGAVMAALLAASVFAGCSRQVQETEVQATRVETQSAARGTLDITGTYIGTVTPYNSVNVTPLVAGTVKSVNVKVGDKVRAGDVLCRFDDTAADLQLKSAQNAVESARAGKEAAEDQIDAARKQADASITSMEGQLKSLRAQKKSSQDQLDQLEENLESLKEAQDAAAQAYAATKKIYDSANALYIQYQAFLSANPDCATTAGLTAAAMPVPAAPPTVQNIGEIGSVTIQAAETTSEASEAETAGGGSQPSSSGEDAGSAPDSAVPAVDAQKQKTAAALLESLGEIPLTVEYLTEAGLNTLKDQMEQAQTASAAAASGYSQAAGTIAQLESGIKQIEAQIDALEDNIDAAEDAADSTPGTKAYDAQIKAAQTGVESAQYQKDLYTVTSPIDGIVESVSVSENEIAAQGYPAFTISDKEAMEVSFYVPEDVRDYVQPGDEVRVEASQGEVKGRISSIATAVDPQKGLFEIKADITTVTDRTLLSNTSVSLSLVTNSVINQILIPFDAVYYDNDQAYVFLIEKNTADSAGAGEEEEGGSAAAVKAVRRNVTTGPYNNDQITILEGLSDGDEVITTWGAGLKDGAPVEIITRSSTDREQ